MKTDGRKKFDEGQGRSDLAGSDSIGFEAEWGGAEVS